MDGAEVHEANESNGFNGYQIIDNKVVLVGDARLDAALDKSGYVLSASWFPVENIVYDDRGMGLTHMRTNGFPLRISSPSLIKKI